MTREALVAKVKELATGAGVDEAATTKLVDAISGSEELKSLVSRTDLQEAIETRDAAKRELSSMKEKLTTLESDDNAAKSEVEKLRTQIAKLEEQTGKIPTLEKDSEEAKALKEILSGRLDKTLESLPENVRESVPESLPLAERLKLAESLLGHVNKTNPGAEMNNGYDGGTTITKSQYADMPVGSKREAMSTRIEKGEVQLVDG